MLNLMKKYTAPFSVTGNEHKLAEIIKSDIAPYVDSVTEDAMGNLIAFKKGEDSSKRTMFAAHMDEIGFVVTYIEENGFIRVTQVGGINPVASSYSEVVFENGVKGVIAIEGGTAFGDIAVKKMFVDIGAKNKKDAEKKVSIGTYLSLTQRMVHLANNRWAAKAFDDRVACAVLVRAAMEAKTVKYDTYYVFTVQEEVGCRGGSPAAYAIEPDLNISLDVTGVGDIPECSRMAVSLGCGPTVKVMDSSVIVPPVVRAFIEAAAAEDGIPYQREVLRAGGTDTGAIQRTRGGILSGCISVPTRYIHTPVETVDMKDVDNAVKLLCACLKRKELPRR